MTDDGLHSVRAELHPQPSLADLCARLERECAAFERLLAGMLASPPPQPSLADLCALLERECVAFERLLADMLASPPGIGSGPPALRLVTRADGPDEGSLDGNQDEDN